MSMRGQLILRFRSFYRLAEIVDGGSMVLEGPKGPFASYEPFSGSPLACLAGTSYEDRPTACYVGSASVVGATHTLQINATGWFLLPESATCR